MTLPNSLGFGGTGFHGDDAVALRTTLSSLVTLANELKADHNLVLAKLDADGGVTDTNYASLHTVAATSASAVSASLGQGGSALHGDGGVATRVILSGLRTLANEIKTDHNAVRTKLAADGAGGGVIDVDYAQATATDEVQLVTVTGATGGTFTLTYDGEETDAIAYNATAATVQAELEQLPNLAVGDVVVTGNAGGPYTVTFGGELADTNVAAITSDVTELDGTNEVQTVTVDATAGNFTITYSGQTTGSLAFNASAATVQTALEALSNLAPGDVVVTGGPGAAGGGTPYTLTFGGTLASTNVAQVTCGDVDLTGGGDTVTPATGTAGVAPTVVITTPTPGVQPLTIVTADVAAIPTSFSFGGAAHSDGAVTLNSCIESLIELLNEAKTKHNLLLDKLDADTGVTDTNYAATRAIAAADAA